MGRPDRKKQLGVMLLVILALGLAVFAALNILKGGTGGPPTPGGLTVTKIPLAKAPLPVREAAEKLGTSRVGYVIPQGNEAYLVISTGPAGERVDVGGAKRAGTMIDIDVRSDSAGERLIVALLKAPVADTRMVQFHLDGIAAGIPALVNRDNLPLLPLPDKGSIVIGSPLAQERVAGGTVQVSGFARIFEGQISIAVYSAGKGRVLGESKNVSAATGAPNWGSFKVNIPYEVIRGLTDGVLLVYDEESGAKVAIPIKFGAQ